MTEDKKDRNEPGIIFISADKEKCGKPLGYTFNSTFEYQRQYPEEDYDVSIVAYAVCPVNEDGSSFYPSRLYVVGEEEDSPFDPGRPYVVSDTSPLPSPEEMRRIALESTVISDLVKRVTDLEERILTLEKPNQWIAPYCPKDKNNSLAI